MCQKFFLMFKLVRIMSINKSRSSNRQEARKLANRLRRYARHRLRMMNHYGALKSMDRVQAADRILKQLDVHHNSTNLSKVINRLEGDAYHIAPGRLSKFRDSALKELESIFSHAKSMIYESG